MRMPRAIRRPVRFTWPLALVLAAAVTAPAGQAQQRLEENPPELRHGPRLDRLPGTLELDPAGASDEPLGTDLRGITLVRDPDGMKAAVTRAGLDLGGVNVPPEVDLRAALQPFLGRPLSLRLMVELRVAIIRAYRDAGYALVAVIVPPQEISSGAVRVMISQFRLAERRVEGTDWSDEDDILDAVRARPGEVIDTDRLIDDLNWLNLNPYRNLVVVAEPGKEFGETNLIFRAEEKKPWTVYAGYNNHGAPSTSENRLYAGFNLANIPLLDHQFGYRFTVSPDAFGRLDHSTSATRKQDAYRAHDGVYFVPLPWRHKLKLRGAFVESRSNLTTTLVSASETFIASAEYAVPLPAWEWVRPEVYGRLAYKRAERDVFFNTVLASGLEIDIIQGAFGLRGIENDALGRTSFELQLVYSPGGITDKNDDANFAAFSGNPGDTADYTYIHGSLRRVTPLHEGMALVSEVIGQWSDDSLPSTDTFSITGDGTVRGYKSLEAAGDRGIVARAEMHFPLWRLFRGDLPVRLAAFDVYPFLDLGYVETLAPNGDEFAASTGLGLSLGFGETVSINGNIGLVLDDGVSSRAGDVGGRVNLVVKH